MFLCIGEVWSINLLIVFSYKKSFLTERVNFFGPFCSLLSYKILVNPYTRPYFPSPEERCSLLYTSFALFWFFFCRKRTVVEYLFADGRSMPEGDALDY